MSDVIASGSDRDPWRPSRRLVGLVVVVAVVLTSLAFAGRALLQRSQERAADQRAARLVSLEVKESTTQAPDYEILNPSGTGLTVTSLRLDFPVGELLANPQQLLAYESLALQPGAGVCDERLYDSGPTVLVVQAVTRKGVRLTRRLSLDAGAKSGIRDQLRRACKMLVPAEALIGEIIDAKWTGSTVRLTYGLNNAGRLPLTLDGVAYEPGVTVTVQPRSVLLPPSPTSGWGPTRRLVVELRVSSCAQLEAALRKQAGGDGLDGRGALKPQLRDAHGSGSGFLELGDHGERLMQTCPNVASYLNGGG